MELGDQIEIHWFWSPEQVSILYSALCSYEYTSGLLSRYRVAPRS